MPRHPGGLRAGRGDRGTAPPADPPREQLPGAADRPTDGPAPLASPPNGERAPDPARPPREPSVESLARLVIRHRLVVVLGWLVLMVAGGVVAGPVTDRLTLDFSLPGQPGYVAEQELIEKFGVSTADTLVPVVTVPEGQTVAERADDIAGVFDAVRAAVPQA